MLINCRMWTTSPQTHTLLKVSLSCTSLKTMKQWSKWYWGQKFNDEIRVKNPQRCSWLVIRQNQFGPQDLNQICWHQKPTRRHVNQSKLHTWWLGPSLSNIMGSSMFSCSHFSLKKKLVSCPRELRQVLVEKVRQWRNQDQWIWCQGTTCVRRKILRKIRVLQIARGIKNWIRVVFYPAAENWRETSTQTQQCSLKRGNMLTLNFPAPGNWDGEMNLQTQLTPGNWSEVRISNSEGRSYTSTIWKSPIIDTLKSLQELAAKVESRRRGTSTRLEGQCIDLGDFFISTTMKACVHLGPNYNEHSEVHRNTNFEELKNLLDIMQRLMLEHEAEILNVSPIDWTTSSWTRSTLMHDQAIKWMKANVHVDLDSVLCLEKMQERSETNERWENKGEEFRQSNSYRELLGRTDWVRVEYFPRTYLLHWRFGDPPEDPERPARPKHWTRKVWRSNHLHVNVQWHRVDTDRKFREMFFKFRTSQELREEILARTLDIPRPWRRKEIVCNSWRWTHKWWNHSKRPIVKCSRATVLWVVEFSKERITEIPYTSMRMLRIQNCCFERFIQELSSDSTEQSQAVAKSSVWCRMWDDFRKISDERKYKKKSSYEECDTARSKFFGANSKEWLMIPYLETDCENVFRTSKHWRKKSHLQKFARIRHSGQEFLLKCATKQLKT